MISDNETRWNTILLTVRRFLMLKEHIRILLVKMKEKNRNSASTFKASDLSDQEWNLLSGLVFLLEKLEEVAQQWF